jgi:hypothetical protein
LAAAIWKVSQNKASKREAGKQLTIWYGHRPFGKASAMNRSFKNWNPDFLTIEDNNRNSSVKKASVLLKKFLARFFV